MRLSKVLLSFDGRINRRQFWLKGILSCIWMTALWIVVFGVTSLPFSFASGEDVTENGFFILILWVPFGLFSTLVVLCICTKRWHDIGRSGWWNLLLGVTVAGFLADLVIGFLVNLLFLLALGLKSGEREPNIYGEVP